MMPVQTSETRASVVPFAPKGSPVSTMKTDDAGQHVIALVQKASDMAKADCQRAMDLANRVSSELRAAEEKARAFEKEANYFRDRAARAEEWLARIESESSRRSFKTNSRSPLARLPGATRPPQGNNIGRIHRAKHGDSSANDDAQFALADSRNSITLARSSAAASPPYGFMLLPGTTSSGFAMKRSSFSLSQIKSAPFMALE